MGTLLLPPQQTEGQRVVTIGLDGCEGGSQTLDDGGRRGRSRGALTTVQLILSQVSTATSPANRRGTDGCHEANRASASGNSGRMTVKPAFGLLIAVGLVAACMAAPSLTLTEPRDGHEVPVICADPVPAAECRELAGAMLEYLQAGDPTYAKVESIEVEPLGQTLPEGAVGGLVTLDHEMFLSSGRQAYRVVRGADSQTFDIEIVLDGEPQAPPE